MVPWRQGWAQPALQWPAPVLLGLQGLTRPVALTQNPGVVVTADCRWHGEAMGKGWPCAASVLIQSESGKVVDM